VDVFAFYPVVLDARNRAVHSRFRWWEKSRKRVGRAILAFFFPALILSVVMIFLAPLLPFIILPLSIIMVVYNFSLFCGAIVGGALA